MFPNLRLTIVAIMASILGISCGLGVFAAFHVNRDPILLSPSGTPPLLVSNATPMAPSEPGPAEPFDTRVTVALPLAPVASTERPLRASAPAPDPTPSQVNSVVARAAEPPESANTEATADGASTEATKAESMTADAARTEIANTDGETKPGGASELSSGDSSTVAPTILSIVETSAGEQSAQSSVNGEKTVRPASAKTSRQNGQGQGSRENEKRQSSPKSRAHSRDTYQGSQGAAWWGCPIRRPDFCSTADVSMAHSTNEGGHNPPRPAW